MSNNQDVLKDTALNNLRVDLQCNLECDSSRRCLHSVWQTKKCQLMARDPKLNCARVSQECLLKERSGTHVPVRCISRTYDGILCHFLVLAQFREPKNESNEWWCSKIWSTVSCGSQHRRCIQFEKLRCCHSCSWRGRVARKWWRRYKWQRMFL